MLVKKKKYKAGGKFPDLTGDGKVTYADVLKGRGVEKKAKGGKLYAMGGVNGSDKKKALQGQLAIARDPKTNYANEEARQKDIAMLQAKLKSLK